MHKLVLNGPFKLVQQGNYPGRLSRWDALASLTQIDHLELVDVDHTHKGMQRLGTLTQLTYLRLDSISRSTLPQLNNQLTNLSSLTKLNLLVCRFCSTVHVRACDSSECGKSLKQLLMQQGALVHIDIQVV